MAKKESEEKKSLSARESQDKSKQGVRGKGKSAGAREVKVAGENKGALTAAAKIKAGGGTGAGERGAAQGSAPHSVPATGSTVEARGKAKGARAQAEAKEPVKILDQKTISVVGRSVGQNVQVQQVPLPLQAVKVKNIVATVRDVRTEIIPNKVIVQGIIHKQIFFVGTDNIVHHLPEDLPFSTFVEVPGAQPGMNAQVRPVVEHIAFHLAPDGMSLTQKVILQVFVKVTETVQLNLVPGSGPLALLQEVIGENTNQALVENTVTLAQPALKIVDIVARLVDITTEVIANKVIIQGVVHKQIFFVGTDNVERHQAEEVPFSHFVDIPGAAPGMNVQVHPTIEHIAFTLLDPVTLEQKVIIAFFVKVTQAIQAPVSPGTGPLLLLNQVMGENSGQFLAENVFTLANPALKVREIVATVTGITGEVIPNKVIIQGTIHKQIFYVDTANVERHQEEDVPFSQFVDVPGALPGMDVAVESVIETVIFNLEAPTTLRQKVVVNLFVKVTEARQLQVLVGSGPLAKVEQVIGENVKQVLVVPPPFIVRPITVIRQRLRLPEQIQGQRQILVENTVTTPTPVTGVREIVGTITDLTAEVIPDAVLVSGNVRKNIQYFGPDGIVRGLEEVVPFTILINLPGVTPGTAVEVRVEIEDISFQIPPTQDRIEQLLVIQGFASVGEARQVTVVTDVIGEGVNVSKIRVRAQVVRGENLIIQEQSTITSLTPPAASITNITATPVGIVGSSGMDVVTVTGTIEKVVEYLGTDGLTHVTTESIPVNIPVPVPGARPGLQTEVNVTILNINFTLDPTGTVLSQTLTLRVFAKAFEVAELDVVTDVSGPGIIEVVKETLVLDVVGVGPTPVTVVTDVIVAT